MKLTHGQIAALADLLHLTHDHEADCKECLQNLAEYTEQILAERPLSNNLHAVKRHLLICAECREEYQTLTSVIVKVKRSESKPNGFFPR